MSSALEPTRRGFLAGLLGLTVVAVLPKVPGLAPVLPDPIDPFDIQAPTGTTYQWVRCALLGEPDPANVTARVENGWTFVTPATHPGAPTATLGASIEACGLVLMQRPTVEVEAQSARERAEIEAGWAAQGFSFPTHKETSSA